MYSYIYMIYVYIHRCYYVCNYFWWYAVVPWSPRSEPSFFFRLSQYQQKVIQHIEALPSSWAKVDLRTSCENLGGLGARPPPVHWNLILTLGFGCHRKPSFGRGFGTWRCWQMLCACGGHWAPYWAHRAPSWRLAACWAHVGASLGTSCYMLGPQWHHVGRSSPNPTHLHPILAAPDRSTHCAILFVYATDALAISSLLTY